MSKMQETVENIQENQAIKVESLQAQIKNLQKEVIPTLPQETVDKLFNAIEDMQEKKLAKDAIKVGDKLPNGELLNIKGGKESIKDIIDAPTVISFYRGSWCPYCNLEINALKNILPQIEQKGAKLIAISPELPDESLTFAQKNELEFDVYTDTNNNYARSLGIVFRLEDEMNEVYKSFGFDIEKSNGISTQELPFGATFVVDKDANVTCAFVTEDYTQRAEPQDILKELDKLA